MKNLKSLFGIAIILTASACTSTYHAGTTPNDDVYYSAKDNAAVNQQTYPTTQAAPANNYSNGNNSNDQNNSTYSNTDQNSTNQNQAYTDPNNNGNGSTNDYNNSSQSTDSKGNTYVTNNYYDDYYDYQYSSRIRRFYTPAIGYNYYDPFYTNSYWYDYSPASYGVSIYLGYNWWAPTYYYYQPFCYGGFSNGYGYGYGYGYYPHSYWGYNSGGYGGYYGGYSGYYGNNYNHGYNDGYYNGYYAGNSNPYYYNSYDNTSHYYGPRGSLGDNSPRGGGRTSTGTLGQKYEQAVIDGKVPVLPTSIGGSRGNSIPTNNGNNPRDVTNGRPGSIQGNGNGQETNAPSKDNVQSRPQSNPNSVGGKNLNDRGLIQNNPTNNQIQQQSTGSDGRTPTVNPKENVVTPRSNPSQELNTTPKNNNSRPDVVPTPRNNNGEINVNPRTNEQIPSSPKSQPNTRPDFTPAPRNNNSNQNQEAPRFNNNSNQEMNSNPRNTSPSLPRQDNNVTPRSSNDNSNSHPSQNNETTRPKQEQSRQQNYEQPRQENRTPIFQPRNEPKQFRQESAPQRSQPSNSSPAPSRSGNGNGNSGGGRKR